MSIQAFRDQIYVRRTWNTCLGLYDSRIEEEGEYIILGKHVKIGRVSFAIRTAYKEIHEALIITECQNENCVVN